MRANTYRAQAQALTFLLCGAQILALSAASENDMTIGPQRSSYITGPIAFTDYKTSMLNSGAPVVQTYKANQELPIDNRFVASVTNFYERLSSNQTSLGSDINNIIYDSLWDLYLD
ncbi:hypothetical protein [Kluyvera ascorbata]|uniref:hypothetical protein n=1 Tax=Kluyvera ascorbata TaxID=51288 RepID=UPI0022DFDC8B|nr:hypothetical protein [Kluyvera ascorbata]